MGESKYKKLYNVLTKITQDVNIPSKTRDRLLDILETIYLEEEISSNEKQLIVKIINQKIKRLRTYINNSNNRVENRMNQRSIRYYKRIINIINKWL